MSYLAQIGLQDAKDWLRLDNNDNDRIITMMINSASSFFEKSTNVLIYQREKSYKQHDRIYDFPIADTTNLTEKANYYIADKNVTLDVGYASGELPDEVKEVILTMVETKFYANEDEGISNYPAYVMQSINRFRRFSI